MVLPRLIPTGASHRHSTLSYTKASREDGLVDMNARLFDAAGKALTSRKVPAADFPWVVRILGMLFDCQSWPAVRFKNSATTDETVAANLDYWTKLNWGATQVDPGGGLQSLAINPRAILGVTFNQNPFRSYGWSKNNPNAYLQVYQAFKYISKAQSNAPVGGQNPPQNSLTGSGLTYNLQNINSKGFLNFDGLTSQAFNGQTPTWAPHGQTLWAGTALGTALKRASGGSYAYMGGTTGATTTVFVKVDNTNVTVGEIDISLVKYQNGDEIEWTTIKVAKATGAHGVTATFTGVNSVTAEDDYAIVIEAECPEDLRTPLTQDGVQIGGVPITFGFFGACAMTFAWGSLPELWYMLTEGVGYRGLAMHIRIYYDGPEGTQGAPNGDLAAAKVTEVHAWRNMRDKCHATPGTNGYVPITDLAVYGPNRDEMSHYVDESTHGLRYHEKINCKAAYDKMDEPWSSTISFNTQSNNAQPWVDSINFDLDYRLSYTLWTIDVDNDQNIANTTKSTGVGAQFAIEISWAIERRVQGRPSMGPQRAHCRAADWDKAEEVEAALPWACADTDFAWNDIFLHPNLGEVDPESYAASIALASASAEHKAYIKQRMEHVRSRHASSRR